MEKGFHENNGLVGIGAVINGRMIQYLIEKTGEGFPANDLFNAAHSNAVMQVLLEAPGQHLSFIPGMCSQQFYFCIVHKRGLPGIILNHIAGTGEKDEGSK
jgi:hypothetical protein